MSFALTTEQVRRREKTVTRRLGWAFAKPGDVVQPIVKGQGIPKGGSVERIGRPIRFVSVSREPLDTLLDESLRAAEDVCAEGFPELTAYEFVEMFCEHNDCKTSTVVTRIAFEYLK